MITREKLVEDYLDYVNNYLTLALYVEHRGLYIDEAECLITAGRMAHQRKHPEA